MIQKSSKVILTLLFFAVVGGGMFAIISMKNTFVVENSNAASQEAIVYLDGANPNKNPEELVAKNISRVKILPTGIGYLNVRADSSVSSEKIGTVKPGEEYEYTESTDEWYRIVLADNNKGWVYAQFAEKLEE